MQVLGVRNSYNDSICKSADCENKVCCSTVIPLGWPPKITQSQIEITALAEGFYQKDKTGMEDGETQMEERQTSDGTGIL